PDITYTVMFLTQFNSKPSPCYLIAAKGTLCYLAKTRTWLLQYGGDHRQDLLTSLGIKSNTMALSDADWGSNSLGSKINFRFLLYIYSGD
ncbi:hypothetical protein GG344DRAFT_59651, partial [Lentinula edodes]